MVGEGGGREGRGQGIRRGGRGHSPFPLPPAPTLIQGPRGVARGKEGRPGITAEGAGMIGGNGKTERVTTIFQFLPPDPSCFVSVNSLAGGKGGLGQGPRWGSESGGAAERIASEGGVGI